MRDAVRVLIDYRAPIACGVVVSIFLIALLSTFSARGNQGLAPFGLLVWIVVFMWLAWRSWRSAHDTRRRRGSPQPTIR